MTFLLTCLIYLNKIGTNNGKDPNLKSESIRHHYIEKMELTNLHWFPKLDFNEDAHHKKQTIKLNDSKFSLESWLKIK